MLAVLLISAAASGITLGNADQYCGFQYGWQLATHNPAGTQQSFEECLRHPPHRAQQADGASADDGPMFPPSSCIPTEPDAACRSAK